MERCGLRAHAGRGSSPRRSKYRSRVSAKHSRTFNVSLSSSSNPFPPHMLAPPFPVPVDVSKKKENTVKPFPGRKKSRRTCAVLRTCWIPSLDHEPLYVSAMKGAIHVTGRVWTRRRNVRQTQSTCETLCCHSTCWHRELGSSERPSEPAGKSPVRNFAFSRPEAVRPTPETDLLAKDLDFDVA